MSATPKDGLRIWRGPAYANVECDRCEALPPEVGVRANRTRTADSTRKRRWAAKHARQNPGHRVHVAYEDVTTYEMVPR